MTHSRLRLFNTSRAVAAALLASASCMSLAAPARAQQLVATVNDSPVTNFDVEQRAKLNRVLRLPTTREALLEGIYEDRLKLAETKKYGMQPSEQDAMGMIGRTAAQLKTQPQILYASMQKAGVSADAIKEHFGASYAWSAYVRTLNKTLDVSQTQIRAELAKKGSKGGADYSIRQIVFIVPTSASPAILQNRMREAEGLRNRFTDCAAGSQLARQLPDVAVKEAITRSSATLPDQLAEVIGRTQIGHLTPPSRTSGGIEMLAVCGKTDAKDSDAAADSVRQELLGVRYDQEAIRLYKEIRAKAVVVNR